MLPVILGLAAAQTYTGLRQAQLIRSQAELNNQIAQYNAQNIERDAYEAEKYGFTQSARYQNTVDGVIADQRVGEAAANVDVSFGTAAELQHESTVVGFLNTLDIQKEARNKSQGLMEQASNVRLGGAFSQAKGYADAAATVTSSILKGIDTGVTGWAKYANGPDLSPNSAPNRSYTGQDYSSPSPSSLNEDFTLGA